MLQRANQPRFSFLLCLLLLVVKVEMLNEVSLDAHQDALGAVALGLQAVGKQTLGRIKRDALPQPEVPRWHRA